MPKKSFGRKKGIQRFIPRRRVGSKSIAAEQEDVNNETEGSQFLCFSRSKLLTFGTKCFNLLLASCGKFHLIGFKSTENGKYVPLSGKGQILHYAAIVFCLALCMHKILATIHVFLYKDLGMEAFICLSITLVYSTPVLLAVGVVLKPKETMDLHNSWADISDSLKMIDPSSKFHPLDNISACLKTISSFLMTQGIVVAVALLSLIMSDLPVFLFSTAGKIGLLPEGILPSWAWQVMFVPLEWIVAQPFMLIAAFSGDFFFMETGLLDVYLRQLRNINVRGMESRRRLEQMYVQLELFNGIGQAWIRFFIPAWVLTLSTTVIVTIFVTIRYTELPFICYMFFPYTGTTLMVLIFWQSYDMLHTIRASEDILGKLWQHEAPYFQQMTRAERIEKMKRSKAMKPLVFSLGDSEFSLSVPINAWDEILNQILFLLSL